MNNEEVLCIFSSTCVFSAAVVTILFLAGQVCAGPQVGDPAPQFTLPDTTYVSHSLSDFQGKVVVLSFWYSQCSACQTKIPKYDIWCAEYDTLVAFIAVNPWEPMSTVKEWARNHKELFLRDAGANVYNQYKHSAGYGYDYVIRADANQTVHGWIHTYFYEDQMKTLIDEAVNMMGVEEMPVAGRVVSLSQNHPNPFAGSTRIKYGVAEATRINLGVYDITGKLVKTLEDGVVNPGDHTVEWDGTNNIGEKLSNGIYFCRIAPVGSTRAMILVR